ncbi:MAG: hypothetical protein A2664_03820 [Candidatus Taylorbacteria bacterium RIFCSPHIGHO2_01_FULL_46_22b]|uniref:Uncharacterized protein n=1 Tax=Candidatus Taylorbacteria bacterium RIFCSPHIGHO2_01_FULL_46_22b TaxID=1802301 RepID=A0A1G2M1S1_9BACT|nr:MAG: hypothetical protein A2664_03820 [Candidatus Taylorbacteria bacterium RIFCSPHIGHO2_01_FULL_46_22b]
MHFASGHTRTVLLIGGVAIKFASLFQPRYWLHGLKRLRLFAQRREVGGRLRHYHPNPLAGGILYYFWGMRSNLLERDIWRDCQHLPLAPTYVSFWGLVNIQRRGTPIQTHELALCPFRDLAQEHPNWSDLHKPEHFCWIGDRICLIDCGGPELGEALRAYRKIPVATGRLRTQTT